MGYHMTQIPKGILGDLSKIAEEVLEAMDAEKQHNPVMVLLELSDVIGAIDAYLQKNYDGKLTLSDLSTMALATQRAFQSGERT